MIISSMIGFNLVMPASAELAYTDVKSPELQCNVVQKKLTKPDNSGLTGTLVNVKESDKKLDISFDTSGGAPIPTLAEGEKYFVSLENFANNSIIESQYLTKKAGTTIGCSIEVPYYCDRVEIKLYKQKATDPDFTVKDENYIGKARIFMSDETVYGRGEKKPITIFNEYEAVKANFTSRITPNYYTVEMNANQSNYFVGKIVLPEEVSEFKFYIFHTNILDNNDSAMYYYDIKLDRK